MYSQERQSLVYGAAIAVVIVCSICKGENQVVEIQRGRRGDLVRLTTSEGVCQEEPCQSEQTYVLDGETCRDDVTLQDKCNLQLVPSISRNGSADSIHSFIAENGSLMVLDSATNQYGVGILHFTDAVLSEDENCTVAGLTVLRKEDIELSHSGFTIVYEADIEILFVDKTALAYPIADYDGELYRMNISCSNDSNTDCIIFKLNGTTDLTKGKFHERVSPQALKITNSCLNEDTSLWTIIYSNTILRYTIFGTAGALGLLWCLVMVFCMAACRQHHKFKRLSRSLASLDKNESGWFEFKDSKS